MALNELVTWPLNDLYYGQLAPAQANREDWYPGKRPQDVREGDANWELDYRVPTSIEEGGEAPIEVQRVRRVKLGRNIVGDQPIAGPETEPVETTTIDDDATWGTVVDPSYSLTPTNTQDVNGEQERITSYDWAKGLV